MNNERQPTLLKRQPIVYDTNARATEAFINNVQIEQARVGIHAVSIRNTNCSNPQRNNSVGNRIISLKRSIGKSVETDSVTPAPKRTKITWP